MSMLSDGIGAPAGVPARVLVWGGTVVTAQGEVAADVLIEHGRVAEVRERPPGALPEEPPAEAVPAEAAVIVARGNHVLPAAYDMRVQRLLLEHPFLGRSGGLER